MKLHHVGIAVKSLDESVAHYRAMGLRVAHQEDVPSQKVKVVFMGDGPYIELLEPTSPDSPVAKFLEKRGPGQHHLAFSVPSIAEELKRQASAGVELIDRAARPGAWGHKVAFLHPKSQGGVLIELVEEGH